MNFVLLNPVPFKHLNMVDGAPVSAAFAEALEFVCDTKYDTLKSILETDEWNSMYWAWQSKNTLLDDTVVLYRVPVKQNLRHGKVTVTHIEVWLFALFTDSKGAKYLCPLKRESDYTYNIFKSLQTAAA